MAELKPCPFCGGRAWTNEHTCIKGPTYYTVHCTGCGISDLKHHKSADDATEAWNRRAEDGKTRVIDADKLMERFRIVAQSGGPVVYHVSDICATIEDEATEEPVDAAPGAAEGGVNDA